MLVRITPRTERMTTQQKQITGTLIDLCVMDLRTLNVYFPLLFTKLSILFIVRMYHIYLNRSSGVYFIYMIIYQAFI